MTISCTISCPGCGQSPADNFDAGSMLLTDVEGGLRKKKSPSSSCSLLSRVSALGCIMLLQCPQPWNELQKQNFGDLRMSWPRSGIGLRSSRPPVLPCTMFYILQLQWYRDASDRRHNPGLGLLFKRRCGQRRQGALAALRLHPMTVDGC